VCLLLALTLNGSELVLLGLAHLGEQVLLPVVQHLPQLPYVCVCVYVWCVCVCVCVYQYYYYYYYYYYYS
jgi:hypothetical protein